MTRSRSVTIPTRASPSTTGSEPTFSYVNLRAASAALASFAIELGEGVIASRTVAFDILPS